MSDILGNDQLDDENTIEFVTVLIAGQMFGLPIAHVEDVFMLQSITEIPLSSKEVAGVLNLRGRIVTAIDMRARLGVPPREDDGVPMAVGVEYKGESYGLIIDTVGEVLRLKKDAVEQNPANLDPRWRSVAKGIYQLDGDLMVVLDIDQVLEALVESMAA